MSCQARMQTHRVLIFLFILLPFKGLMGQHVLSLNDRDLIYTIDSTYFVVTDSLGVPLRMEENKLFFSNPDPEKAAWFRFKIRNNSLVTEWYLVSYNFSVDEIDLIEISAGHKTKEIFRDTMGIMEREIHHKQPVFTLSFAPGETKEFLLRIKNESSYQYTFGLYSGNKFFSHFFKEYLLYGLFYGLMLFVFLFSLMYFFQFRDRVTILYILFIGSLILYMLFRDGNGLFLLPQSPEYADLIKNLSRTGFTVFLLLYTVYFFRINEERKIFRIILIVVGARLLHGFLYLENTNRITFDLELVSILLATYVCWRALKKSIPEARYMLIGLIVLSLTYIIYYTGVQIIPSIGGFGFFAMYYGIAGASIFLTMGLMDRFKQIKLENVEKDIVNRKLEVVVDERTRELIEKNKLLEEQSNELNQYLYQTYHDLKGPIKSIHGLCALSAMDGETSKEEIISMIRNKVQVLEDNIVELNTMASIRTEKEMVKIDFKNIHEEVIRYLKKRNYDLRKTNLIFNLSADEDFYSSYSSFLSVYRNLVENSVKFADLQKDSFVKVNIWNDDAMLRLTVEDNGVGINKDVLPNIFKMFYRGNIDSRDSTGLGLYIVKVALQHLKGSIEVDSKEGAWTKVEVKIPFSDKPLKN